MAPVAGTAKHQSFLSDHKSSLFGGSFSSIYKHTVISLIKRSHLFLDLIFHITCHSFLLISAKFSAELFIIFVSTSSSEVLHHPLRQLLWSPLAFPVLSNFPFSTAPDITISYSLSETLSSLVSRTQPSLGFPLTSLAPPPGPPLLFILLTKALEWRTQGAGFSPTSPRPMSLNTIYILMTPKLVFVAQIISPNTNSLHVPLFICLIDNPKCNLPQTKLLASPTIPTPCICTFTCPRQMPWSQLQLLFFSYMPHLIQQKKKIDFTFKTDLNTVTFHHHHLGLRTRISCLDYHQGPPPGHLISSQSILHPAVNPSPPGSLSPTAPLSPRKIQHPCFTDMR